MECYYAYEIVSLYYKEFWKLAQIEAELNSCAKNVNSFDHLH